MTNRAADLDAIAARLPEPEVMKRSLRALAVFEVIRHDRWRTSFFDVTKPYGSVGTTNNGAGDEFSVYFLEEGTFIRTFDHESDISPWARLDADVEAAPYPGLLEPLPEVFAPVLADPELLTNFGVIPVTGTFWRLAGETTWSHGQALDPQDGSPWSEDASTWADRLVSDYLPLTVEAYTKDQEENGNPADGAAFAHVWAGLPLTQDIVNRIGVEWRDEPRALADVLADLVKVGYPV